MASLLPIYNEDYSSQGLFQKYIGDFLEKAQHDAKQILNPNDVDVPHDSRSHGSVKKIKIGNTYKNGVFVDNSTTYSSNRGQNDQGIRIVVGIIATIITGASMYVIGRTWKAIQDSQDRIQETESFGKRFRKDIKNSNPQNKHVKLIRKVMKARSEILHEKKTRSMQDLTLTIGLVVSSVIALIGAFAGSAGLMLTGVAGGIVVGALFMLKWGLNSSDSRLTQWAQKINQKVEVLNSEKTPIKSRIIPIFPKHIELDDDIEKNDQRQKAFYWGEG